MDAVEPQIWALLAEYPRMPATVIAERIGWARSLTILKDRVRDLRPLFVPPDPADRIDYRPGEADWTSPELARHAMGFALQQMTDRLQADKLSGVVTRGEFAINPTIASAEPEAVPTRVRIADCGDGSQLDL